MKLIDLPDDLLLRIFSFIDVKNRLQLGVVSRRWRNLSMTNCTQLNMRIAKEWDDPTAAQQCQWLQRLAALSSHSLDKLVLKGSSQCIVPVRNLGIERFTRLRELHISSNMSKIIVTAEAVQRLSSLVNLARLTLHYAPSPEFCGWGNISPETEKIITLQEFSIFKNLQSLGISFAPSDVCHLELAHAFEGWDKLEQLELTGLHSMTLNSAFHNLAKQIQGLTLGLAYPVTHSEVPMSDGSLALKHLSYTVKEGYNVPPLFATAQLSHLSMEAKSVFLTGRDLTVLGASLKSLQLELFNGVDLQVVPAITCLRVLKQLKILYSPSTVAGVFEPFSALQSLEELILSLEWPVNALRGGVCHIPESFTALTRLERFHFIDDEWQPFHLQGLAGHTISRLQGLTELEILVPMLSTPVSSSSLKIFSLSMKDGQASQGCSCFGLLPAVEKVVLKYTAGFKGIALAMNALRQVPNLSVLRLDWNSSKFDEQFEDISIEDAGPDSVEYHDRTHLLQLVEILSTFRQLEVVSIDTLKALVIDSWIQCHFAEMKMIFIECSIVDVPKTFITTSWPAWLAVTTHYFAEDQTLDLLRQMPNLRVSKIRSRLPTGPNWLLQHRKLKVDRCN